MMKVGWLMAFCSALVAFGCSAETRRVELEFRADPPGYLDGKQIAVESGGSYFDGPRRSETLTLAPGTRAVSVSISGAAGVYLLGDDGSPTHYRGISESYGDGWLEMLPQREGMEAEVFCRQEFTEGANGGS